jgi:hypothetical protein
MASLLSGPRASALLRSLLVFESPTEKSVPVLAAFVVSSTQATAALSVSRGNTSGSGRE